MRKKIRNNSDITNNGKLFQNSWKDRIDAARGPIATITDLQKYLALTISIYQLDNDPSHKSKSTKESSEEEDQCFGMVQWYDLKMAMHKISHCIGGKFVVYVQTNVLVMMLLR